MIWGLALTSKILGAYKAYESTIMYMQQWYSEVHALPVHCTLHSLDSIEDDSSFASVNHKDEPREEYACAYQTCTQVTKSREELFHI